MATGAAAVVRALEEEGARLLFGVPGTHNLGLYDALLGSAVRPVLAHDERAAAFMADGVSRSSAGIGVLSVVPGAGLTHALSGIAEAFLDQVPMVALVCGVRSDLPRSYQLHEIDQAALLRPVVKALLRPRRAAELHGAVREAFRIAASAPAGPVAVEVPAELYMLEQRSTGGSPPSPTPGRRAPDPAAVEEAARRLNAASRPAIYAGYGCRRATAALRAVSERLQAPVATTIQGKGAFPETHPLWLWSAIGLAAPPFARAELEAADAVLAVGCRFAEVGTGSYGFGRLRGLIHVDADASVFHRNHRAELAIEADAAEFLEALLPRLAPRPRHVALEERLAAGRAGLRAAASTGERVPPAALFEALQAESPGAVYAVDSGNGLFLAMERLRLDRPGRFLAPTDFSCMGYAVPAAVGARLAGASDVVAIAGDGAFLMTGLALSTAAAERAGLVVCVLRDRELGQIAHFQRLSYGRTSSVRLPDVDIRRLAEGAGAEHRLLARGVDAPAAVAEAFSRARDGRPVVLEVLIDASEPTYFTRGVVRANFRRLPLGDKLALGLKRLA